MGLLRVFSHLALGSSMVLGGYFLVQLISPNKEELIKKLPEAQHARMNESMKKQQQLLNYLKHAADSPHAIWKEEPFRKPGYKK